MKQGRTHPLVVGCRQHGTERPTEAMIVKAVGSPGLFATHQLVGEVIGNAVARQMGLITPEPGIVHIVIKWLL